MGFTGPGTREIAATSDPARVRGFTDDSRRQPQRDGRCKSRGDGADYRSPSQGRGTQGPRPGDRCASSPGGTRSGAVHPKSDDGAQALLASAADHGSDLIVTKLSNWAANL